MKVNAIGVTHINNIKIGEGLIAIGAASVIAGLVVLRRTSQWCSLNTGEAIDEALELYKKHIDGVK